MRRNALLVYCCCNVLLRLDFALPSPAGGPATPAGLLHDSLADAGGARASPPRSYGTLASLAPKEPLLSKAFREAAASAKAAEKAAARDADGVLSLFVGRWQSAARPRRNSGPSPQDLRDTIIPHLRELEPTMDSSTFLVLWHFISNNMHGSWKEAAALYGAPANDRKRQCSSSACLNGGKCYYESEGSNRLKCKCPAEYRGKRCQHGPQVAKENGTSLASAGHREYGSWSSTWDKPAEGRSATPS